MKMTVFIFSVLSTLSIFCSALEASTYTDRDNNANLDYAANSRSSQYLPMKRYTYVSEYKRLPLYNFGIGKRSRPYEFGVGRRSKTYGFGVGKRFNYDDQSMDYLSDASYDPSLNDFEDGQPQYKRSPQRFSFGVGKRSSESSYPESLVNNIKKEKNNTHDLNLYEVYDLMRRLNKGDAISQNP
ncbi:allatostatins [Leptopilina heterotoma]|uniref:allatostatins n=1 Tax=Leptopilina heterotoma TaxID=63436 RepID=UPI001CA7F980|nr:allatostatins [Leptopilina heterotoma]